MNENVYVLDASIYNYNNNKYFNPSNKYKEGIDISIKSDRDVYDQVRNLFILMNLDKKNIGTSKWNPFSEFIKEGDNVVIKPNLVLHQNNCKEGDTDSLITNFSVIRPIIDYTIKALNGTGSIIVGDAPVQNCDFNEVVKLNNLKKSINDYNKKGYKIELKDFRKNNNPNLKCKIVDLNKYSSLCEVDKYSKKYAITFYDLKEIHRHHNKDKHEYIIPEDILNADVIINIPKPKTHRKAGITACMKNFVGANAKKEYLPHHRNGSIHSNGDEFPERSFIKSCKSVAKNYEYKRTKLAYISNLMLNYIIKRTKKDRFQEGSWYGNDTIWRTILDINKIILYADSKGNLNDKKQRVVFNIADMIVSGEKEGPMLPSRKEVGLLVSSFNQLNMDKVICQIMGFKPEKIKYIDNGFKLKKYVLSNNSDLTIFDTEGKVSDISKYNKRFIPTDGWIDYLL